MSRCAMRVGRLSATLLAGAALAAGCSSSPGTRAPRAPMTLTVPASGTVWLLTKAAYDAVSADPAARGVLERGTVYELLGARQAPTPGTGVVPTLVVQSLARLRADLAGGVPPGVRAVLYDAEAWSLTPASEQSDPVSAYADAADVAHAHGLVLIGAPALDLLRVTAGATGAAQPAAYLSTGLAAGVARSVDVLDVQAQRLAGDPAAYASFVSSAADAARHAHPGVVVVSGLSTCAGGSLSAAQLAAAAHAAAGAVSGWWLNVPGESAAAPGCGTPRADVAAAFLAAMSSS